MIRVDTDLLLFGAKWKLTTVQSFELMVGLKIRPAPHSTIDDVRQTFPMGHLEPSVQGAWNGNTLAGLAGTAQRLFQVLHGSLFLLELLHERIDSLFRPLLFLVSLFPSQ